MARTTKPAPTANKATDKAAPAKVGKIDKTAKAEKAPKAEKAEKGESKPRGQYAVGKLRVTTEGKAATLRGGRQVRLDLIRKLDGRPMSEVLGATYRLEGESDDRTLNSGNIAVFIEKGFVEIV